MRTRGLLRCTLEGEGEAEGEVDPPRGGLLLGLSMVSPHSLVVAARAMVKVRQG